MSSDVVRPQAPELGDVAVRPDTVPSKKGAKNAASDSDSKKYVIPIQHPSQISAEMKALCDKCNEWRFYKSQSGAHAGGSDVECIKFTQPLQYIIIPQIMFAKPAPNTSARRILPIHLPNQYLREILVKEHKYPSMEETPEAYERAGIDSDGELTEVNKSLLTFFPRIAIQLQPIFSHRYTQCTRTLLMGLFHLPHEHRPLFYQYMIQEGSGLSLKWTVDDSEKTNEFTRVGENWKVFTDIARQSRLLPQAMKLWDLYYGGAQ